MRTKARALLTTERALVLDVESLFFVLGAAQLTLKSVGLGIGSTGGRGLIHQAGVPAYALHGAALVSTRRINVQASCRHVSNAPKPSGGRARTSGHQRQTSRAGADFPESAMLSEPPLPA